MEQIINQLNAFLNPPLNSSQYSIGGKFHKIAMQLKEQQIKIIIEILLHNNEEVKDIIKQKQEAIKNQNFEYASMLRDKEKMLITKLNPNAIASTFEYCNNTILFKVNNITNNEEILMKLIKENELL